MTDSSEDLPVPRVELRRDNKPHTVAPWFWPVEDDDDIKAVNKALKRLMQVQGQSWDWAMRYEGWSVVLVSADGTTHRMKLNGGWA